MHREDCRRLADGLRRLGLRSYDEYTRSAWWWAYRARRRAAGMVKCAACGSVSRVSLHHVTYTRLGRERPADVVPLCRGHHRAVHGWLDARGLRVTRTHEVLAALAPALGPRVGRAYPRWHWYTLGPGSGRGITGGGGKRRGRRRNRYDD